MPCTEMFISSSSISDSHFSDIVEMQRRICFAENPRLSSLNGRNASSFVLIRIPENPWLSAGRCAYRSGVRNSSTHDNVFRGYGSSRLTQTPDQRRTPLSDSDQQQYRKLATITNSKAPAPHPSLEDTLEEALILQSPSTSSFLYIQAKRWKKLVRSIMSNFDKAPPSGAKRVTYSLVSKRYTRVQLASEKTLTPVPGYIETLISTAADQLVSIASDNLIWIQQLGNRYGGPLLFLLVIGYWIQGFKCFPLLAMTYHLQDHLQVDPSMLQFLQSFANLPMVAKPFYGIISDTIYIGGARRMPYLMMAGVLQVFSWSTIVLHSGIRSSALPLMAILILGNVGGAIAEVINDALVAESIQKETTRTKGELQSFVWLAFAVGGIMGNLMGGLAMSKLSSTMMFAVFSILMAGHLLVTSIVKEESFNFKSRRNQLLNRRIPEKRVTIMKSLKQQTMKLIELVSKPEISKLLLWFAASYALIPALAGNLFFYQTRQLHIHPTYLGLAKVIGQIGLLTGSMLYNQRLKKLSPRLLITAVQVLLSVCILSDIFLVRRWNIKIGIPDHLYVLGASAFIEAIAQFKILPFSVLLTQLCPAGSEGSLLAFFMSCHCLACIVSSYLGTVLATSLHISADSFSGLPLGILVQSMAALVPLLWISCIPNKQQVMLKARSYI